MAFQYRAINSKGKPFSGVVEGDNARQASAKLREKGLIPLTLSPATQEKRRFFRTNKRLRSQELSVVMRQIATLIAANIPVADALASVANQNHKPMIKRVILGVHSKVVEGHSLATGMEQFPAVFPRLYCTTVAAGEKSGKLSQILLRLAEYTERQQQIKRKIAQALIYPLMMLFVSTGVVFFMLIYIVPKIVDVFDQTEQTLPFATQTLIFISQLVKKQGGYFIGGLVAAIYAGFCLLKRPKLRYRLQKILLKIPLLGKAIITINAARFSRTFGILKGAGVPVIDAMKSAAQLINPLPMRSAVLTAVQQVREGGAISKALQQTHYFSLMLIHLIASGENSGQLDTLLQKAAENQEAEVEALINGSLTLFEPLMILVMGGIVMFIVLAIVLPIFALDSVF